MGKAKRKGSTYLDGKEEGRNYRGWEKETLAAVESSLGGEEKSNPRMEMSLSTFGRCSKLIQGSKRCGQKYCHTEDFVLTCAGRPDEIGFAL